MFVRDDGGKEKERERGKRRKKSEGVKERKGKLSH